MGLECASRTDVGLRRKVNEDSVLERPELGLWAVADGMGGHEAGDVASAKVVEALRNLPASASLDAFVERAIAELQRVNRELIALAMTNAMHGTIGTTVVGLAIANGEFRYFWAGDSRGYRMRDGQIQQLTRDHSVVQGLVDAGMLDPGQAQDHPNANLITRAVGVAEDLKVDMVGGEVAAGDQFLLATDGLTRLVADEELAATLRASSPGEAADRFIETALSRGAPDNVSLVIAKVT